MTNRSDGQYSRGAARRQGALSLTLAVALLAQGWVPDGWTAQRRAITAGAMAHTIDGCPEPGSEAARLRPDCDLDQEEILGPRPYTEAELQGVGCLAVGGLATGAAYAVNTNELLMIAAGGTLASGSGAVVALALLSTVAASGCAVGAIAIPVLNRWYEEGVQYVHSWSQDPATTGQPDEATSWRQSWFLGWWAREPR